MSYELADSVEHGICRYLQAAAAAFYDLIMLFIVLPVSSLSPHFLVLSLPLSLSLSLSVSPLHLSFALVPSASLSSSIHLVLFQCRLFSFIDLIHIIKLKKQPSDFPSYALCTLIIFMFAAICSILQKKKAFRHVLDTVGNATYIITVSFECNAIAFHVRQWPVIQWLSKFKS